MKLLLALLSCSAVCCARIHTPPLPRHAVVSATSAINARAASASPLNELARDVERVESIREIKDLTATFSQLAQHGGYTEMAALFSSSGVLTWGNFSVKGPEAIERWLKRDAGDMNGIKPGSMDTLVMATPLVNLSPDGRTAKCRWNGWRFQGDGAGKTRIQGGIYENEYALDDKAGVWKISLLKFYPLYEGDYPDGWRNIGRRDLGLAPPFHYTPDEAGVPIPKPPKDAKAPETKASLEDLQRRIEVLNDEDEVRNLQHSYGYYVDRRMWDEVGDLFGAGWGYVNIDNVGSFEGPHGVQQALEKWMGPEGLSQGILNEHLIFDTVVSVHPDLDPDFPDAKVDRMAEARGIEIGLIGDSSQSTASWRFNTFHNTFIRRNGIWQLYNITISPLMVANFSSGWGKGSVLPQSIARPALLPYTKRPSRYTTLSGVTTPSESVSELQRRLARSAAYDGTENVSNAYGFYIDFIDGVGCGLMADIHARDAHKSSPFAGYYQTRERVLRACTSYYGTTQTTRRSGISFHWRPQPVILVSTDGRSATLRARLLQPATDKNSSAQLRGGMYHDQTAIEDGIWRLWSVTIDEFYWGVSDWKEGWVGMKARAKDAPNPPPRDLIKQYPPDLLLTDMGDPRETGFMGGSGRYVAWPEIQRMWFGYRNPVSGRVPGDGSYWPGCVPCQPQHRPKWNLTSFGWQEPPTGPTVVRAGFGAGDGNSDAPIRVTVTVTAGPGEPVEGVVVLTSSKDTALRFQHNLTAQDGGRAGFSLPKNLTSGMHFLTTRYFGSDRIKPGWDVIDFYHVG